MGTRSDSKKSFLIENSQIEEAGYSPEQVRSAVQNRYEKAQLVKSKEYKYNYFNNKVKSEIKEKSFKKKKSKINSEEEYPVEHIPLKSKEEVYREEDLLGDIGDDRININPEDYYFDKNFFVDEGKVLESREEPDKNTSFKKPKSTIGPRGSTLNKSNHKKVGFMSKKDTIFDEPEESLEDVDDEEIKKMYGTKNLDEENEKKIPQIQVNAPSGSTVKSKSEVEHSDEEEGPPNFRYLQKQKSVESRLKYLSDVYTELIKTTHAQDFLNSVKKIMDIEKLREIEATGSKQYSYEGDSFRDSNDLKDLVIKIDTESLKSNNINEKRSKISEDKEAKKRKDMVTCTADRFNRSSIASYQSKVLQRENIKSSIKRAIRNIFSKPLKRIKFLIFIILIIFTVLIRTNANRSIDGKVSTIISFREFSKAVSPIGYLYKDLNKYKLEKNGYLHSDLIQKSEFFNVGILEEMQRDLMEHFKYLTQNNVNGITSPKHSMQKKSSESGELKENLNFFTLYVNMINDYLNLLENFDPSSPDLLKKTHRFDLESSIYNSFEMVYQSSANFDELANISETIRKEYSFYYLIFLLSNLILTIVIGFILVVLNLRANNMIEMMSNLILRIEKERIRFYSEKFNRVQASVKLITKNKIEAVDQKELRKTLKMGKKKKNDETRRKNFSSFVSKYNSSKTLVCIIIVLTIILVNIPIAIDYVLISGIINKATSLNSISVYSNLLGTDLYGFYGVFYTRIYDKYKGMDEDKRVIEITQKFENLYEKRDNLQNLISGYSVFNKVQEESICNYTKIEDLEVKKDCFSITGNQKNYNLFLALSDVVNFYYRSLATISKSNVPQISTVDLMKFDSILYFISKNLLKVMDTANDKIIENLDSKKSVTILFFVLFVIVI